MHVLSINLLVLLHKFTTHCICKAERATLAYLGGMAPLPPNPPIVRVVGPRPLESLFAEMLTDPTANWKSCEKGRSAIQARIHRTVA